MKNHQLFNEDPDNDDKTDRDIHFIQVFRFNGSKRTAIPKIYDAEELQTIAELYKEVGPGVFELFGRDANNRLIVDRRRIEIEPIEGIEGPRNRPGPTHPPQPEPPPTAPTNPQGAFPMMQGMGLQIPTATDPQTAVLLMVLAQGQQSQAAAREDARATQATMVQLFASINQSQAQMVVGLANAFGGGRGATTGETGTEMGFIKGIEVMAALQQGRQEAVDADEKPLDLGKVAENIATSLGHMSNIATRVSGAGAEAVIPPGSPT